MGFEPRAAERLRLVLVTTRDQRLRRTLAFAITQNHRFEDSSMHSALPGDIARSGGIYTPPAAGNLGAAPDSEAHDHPFDTRSGPADVKRRTGGSGGAQPPALAGLELGRAARELDELLGLAFAASGPRARLLTALRRQDEALRLVLTAHQTGQTTLPAALVERVTRAIGSTPDLLDG